jgi:hypothetical protein
VDEDPQKIWDDYYDRIKARLTAEAEVLWALMEKAGVTEDTVMILDFLHFSPDKENAESLAEQLSENYHIKIIPAPEENFWRVKNEFATSISVH